MTETRLKTLTCLLAYSLSTIIFGLLAVQNLRFGFYALFYPAAGLSAISLAGCLYTLAVSRYQLRARGHMLALLLMHIAALAGALISVHAGTYWGLPVLILTFLVLPLTQALKLALPVAAIFAVILVWQLPLAASLLAIGAGALLVASAGLANWHYEHMTQSAQDLAIIDPLTGAHNARFLDETLQREISRAQATRHPVSVLMLDIDHRDQVAEMLGHEQIPGLYRQLAEHLFTLVRAGDTLYFLGEGRFCLILPFTPEEGARVTAERIRRSIAEATWPQVGRMTVSIGATTHLNQETLGERLRQRATDALEEASRRGQDHVWFSADGRQVA